jgi:hypothetical protein
MADSPRHPDPGGHAGPGPESTGTPRWVKVFGIIAGVVAILLVVLLLAGGNHGPSRHLPSGGGAGEATPAGAHTPPPGGHEP